MSGRLKDRVALIIGAARGIGAGIAERFIEEGAKIVIADSETAAGEETAKRFGGRFVAIDADSVTRLATLPSREVLLAKLAGGMQAPVGQLAGLFAAPLRNLGYALAQVAEQKRSQSPEA